MAVILKVTEIRPDTSTPWAIDRPGTWGDDERQLVNDYLTWFNANRSETIVTSDVSDLEKVHSITFASKAEFDNYVEAFQNSGLTGPLNPTSPDTNVTMTFEIT